MPAQRLVPSQVQKTFTDSYRHPLIFRNRALFQLELAERLVPCPSLAVKHGKVMVHAGRGRRCAKERLVFRNGYFVASPRSVSLRLQPPQPDCIRIVALDELTV